jgi:hypothetical protein
VKTLRHDCIGLHLTLMIIYGPLEELNIMSRMTRERMTAVLGKAHKPLTVWQQQFDGFNETLLIYAKSEWYDVPGSELWAYIHDLTYQELQPDLFKHLFPACLKFWYDTLMRNEDAAVGDADLHHALLHGNILTKMLDETERQRLFEFFADGFLDRVELERDFSCERPKNSSNAWIGRFNSIGLVAPIIPKIWTDWWSMDSPGKAVCAMMYASGLIYWPGENPIYLPWTPAKGGGGPYLTEWDSNEFDNVWLDSNVSFMRSVLTPAYIIERMDAAASTLRSGAGSSLATQIANDARSRGNDIEIRIDALLENLIRRQLEKDLWDW